MTDKVFVENNKEKNDEAFKKQLETVLRHKIIFIPWHCINPKDEDSDVYGHSDGFVHWCGGNKVMMSNHRNTDPKEASEIRRIMESFGFEVTEMLFDVPHPEPLPQGLLPTGVHGGGDKQFRRVLFLMAVFQRVKKMRRTALSLFNTIIIKIL